MAVSRWAEYSIKHVKMLGKDIVRIPRKTSISGCDKFALEYDKDVLLLIALIPLGKWSKEIFLFPGAKIYDHRLEVMWRLATGLESYVKMKKLQRVQANTVKDKKLISFMERLGFVQESILRKYNNGQDHIMWTRIYGG